MKYLNSSTTSISIVIAVVLFGVATWLEGERPEPDAAEDGPTPKFLPQVQRDTAVRESAGPGSCDEAEAVLKRTVETARACSTDDDCTLLDYGYPIQCLTSIAQESVTAVRLEYRQYEASCSHRVYYDCPSEPLVRVPVCRQNRCEVDLEANERLKELTLDYINRIYNRSR